MNTFNPHRAVTWGFLFSLHSQENFTFCSQTGPECTVTCTESYCYNGLLIKAAYFYVFWLQILYFFNHINYIAILWCTASL